MSQLKSAIYQGEIRHRRMSPCRNDFSYPLYMLALDVNELTEGEVDIGVLGSKRFKPIRINEKDYLPSEPGCLSERIKNKVVSLGGVKPMAGITMLVQARCFGLYFSPANFYFGYDNEETCIYMLVEVSNTPWNKRHYYLVDMTNVKPTDKAFHVSPFMDLAMQYHWRVKAPKLQEDSRLLVHIENKRSDSEKVFDATLSLKRLSLSKSNVFKLFYTFPMMTWKVVVGIYYQALKLFLKRIPFVPYQEKKL